MSRFGHGNTCQIGKDDNWTLPAPCMELVEVANATGGSKMAFDAYDGAVHSFDHQKSKRRTIGASDGRRVRIGTDPVARSQAIERIKGYLRAGFR